MMRERKQPYVQIIIRVSPECADALKSLATAQRRSIPAQVGLAVDDYVRRETGLEPRPVPYAGR